MAGEVRSHTDCAPAGDDVGARANSGAQQDIEERKPRKSVAFSEGTTIVDENGDVTQETNGTEGSKDTAMSHSSSTLAMDTSVAMNAPLTAFTGPDAPAEEEDDVAAMLAGMKKKKKSKKTEDAEGADGLDLTMKKKKKSKKPKDGEDEFAAKLAALDIEKDGEADDAAPEPESEAVEDVGDMEEGTGIWQHDNTTVVSYEHLLSRFFSLLAQKNPDHASSGARSYKIPPPQCLREGNKKTIFANINEICKRMKRTDEHVTQYLFAELGTSGSVDGSRRLVIKGRFQQKQIENVLRRYISMSTSEAGMSGRSALINTQWSTSLARPADRQIPSSTRERTACPLSPVTLADPAVPSPLSRPVSPPRSESASVSKHKLVAQHFIGGATFMSHCRLSWLPVLAGCWEDIMSAFRRVI